MIFSPRDFLPGRGNTHELTLVRGARGVPFRHQIPLGDGVLQGDVDVGERGENDPGNGLLALGSVRESFGGQMQNGFRGK